ncbi:hypothetical protein ACFO0S_02145 [Chryseomicrobium palamuruense]|uniref:DUF4367 domain-containing protein n=1 Tax=Chryseomicrobium palamuruense TaxID=682973 RepID=A0ABV8UTI7_9BACL
MDENKFKESIADYIGDEKLFNEQLKGRILTESRTKKQKREAVYMFSKLAPLMVLVLVIVGGTVFYLISNTLEKQVVSPPNEVEMEVPTQENEGSISTSLDEIDHERLREPLNTSFRIISAMINKDYEYLASVIEPSVKLNRENNSFTFTFSDSTYEQQLIENFDYNNFEYRGYRFEGDSVYIILGVYNASFEFEFVEAENGTYLLKSFLTN